MSDCSPHLQSAGAVIEMGLCEVPHVMLRPDRIYRFVVVPGCVKCETAAAPYLGNTGPDTMPPPSLVPVAYRIQQSLVQHTYWLQKMTLGSSGPLWYILLRLADPSAYLPALKRGYSSPEDALAAWRVYIGGSCVPGNVKSACTRYRVRKAQTQKVNQTMSDTDKTAGSGLHAATCSHSDISDETLALIRKAIYCGLSVGVLNGELRVIDLTYFGYMSNSRSHPLSDEGVLQACSNYLYMFPPKYEAGKIRVSKLKDREIIKFCKRLRESGLYSANEIALARPINPKH